MIHPHLLHHMRTEVWSAAILPGSSLHRVAHTKFAPYAPCSQHDGQTATYMEGCTVGYPFGERIEQGEP